MRLKLCLKGVVHIKTFIFIIIILLFTLFSGYSSPGDTANAPNTGESALFEPVAASPLGNTTQQLQESLVPATEAPELDIPEDTTEIDIPDDILGATVEETEPPRNIVTLTISAAGDTTLGGDIYGAHVFMREFELHDRDHSHFLRNVRHIFEQDDLTLINLEGTLTEATTHVDKTYVLRGPPHFAKILSSSGVDAVTLANNHSKDFFERGYQDTLKSLEADGIAYFGNNINTILEIKGIRVGLFGLAIWSDGANYERQIKAAVENLKEKGAQIIIAYYHWGTENSNEPARHQRTLGRYSIDNGVSLVLGAHPHVLQGIEEYKGKNIVYSLANFSFGANNFPSDYDTIIFQQTFTFDEGILQDTNETNIIPAFVSSEKGRNNFQPTIAQGEEAERILQRIKTYSEQLTN